MKTREEKIGELDRRETAKNIPSRRGILARCYSSIYYRRPPVGKLPDEPKDWEIEMALDMKG